MGHELTHNLFRSVSAHNLLSFLTNVSGPLLLLDTGDDSSSSENLRAIKRAVHDLKLPLPPNGCQDLRSGGPYFQIRALKEAKD